MYQVGGIGATLRQNLRLQAGSEAGTLRQDHELGMELVRLETRSVGDLAYHKQRFLIPSYQRGYRWEQDQVRALLNDLYKFELNDFGKFYCLQPLVVVERKNAWEGKDAWEVVDGQQRLTTIFLVLKQLSTSGQEPFSICYERHPKSKKGLHQLLQTPFSDNADAHYLCEALREIKRWFDEPHQKRPEFTSLTNREGRCAKFIWNEIKDRDEAIRAFTRLNAGKIRLKDSELIRALWLQSGGLEDDSFRQHIARQWDRMERRLQNPEFWSFLNKDVEAPDSRIEFLFRLLIGERYGTETKDRKIFDRYFEVLNSNKVRKKLWRKVENLFGTLEEWFEDNRLFHLIGFLIEHGESISSLRADSAKLGKKKFIKKLKENIRSKVLVGVATDDAIRTYLNSVNYGNPTVKSLLLCLNLATLDADTTGTVRFSFHAYKKEKGWDIEHIRATASRVPEKIDEISDALRMMCDYLKQSNYALDEQLKIHLATAQVELERKPEDRERLTNLYASMLNKMERCKGDEELEASNGLENLTLLDAETNRGYGNSPFAVKRWWALGIDQQAKYLLPCTRNVLTKTYSKAPGNLLCWTPRDSGDYLTSITKVLSQFFADTWKDNE